MIDFEITLSELYESHWAYWLGIARRYKLDEEDTVQQAIANLWSKREKFEWRSKEELLSLINIMVYNESRHRARGTAYHSSSVDLSLAA